MFPQSLIQVCATVGVVLLPLSLAILRYYKTKVRSHVNDAFSKLLSSKGISRFTKKVDEKKVTFEMISDFYQQFSDANYPNIMFAFAWKSIILSGVFFIFSSLVGSIDVGIFAEFFSFQFLGVGATFLIIGIYLLVKLEGKL